MVVWPWNKDYLRFRAVRNALATPGSAWYLMHLANMSTIAREWLALHAFPSLPFAHTILSGGDAFFFFSFVLSQLAQLYKGLSEVDACFDLW